MLEPFARAGWTCHNFDIKNEPLGAWAIEPGYGSMQWHKWDAGVDNALYHVIGAVGRRVDFIACFAPCTDLAGLGAKHWKKKLEADPECQTRAVSHMRYAEDLGNYYNCAWFSENPVGAASRIWRKPDYYFNPCDYGGYLPKDDQHPQYPELIPPRDAYNKKTCIWCGNGFKMPDKKPVEPEILEDAKGNRGSRLWLKLGGKSEKTKTIRSKTPRGWALAAHEANG